MLEPKVLDFGDNQKMGLEIIIYIFLTLGGGSAIITIAIILSNRMYASVYPALILAIQTFNLGICLVDICYTESADCKVSAVFFYFFWMVLVRLRR